MTREIVGFLKMNDVEYKENVSLSSLSTIKIGGVADLVAYPDTPKKLLTLTHFLENSQIRYKILGRMSNVLPPDEKFSGVVVKTDHFSDGKHFENKLYVSSGMSLTRLALMAEKNALSGIEELAGIPGSVGGAIIGNAGAFGREISDSLISVLVYHIRSNQVVKIKASDISFGYRTSLFKNGEYVILYAEFKLCYENEEKIAQRMRECSRLRRLSQPTDKPSLGSTFKRPSCNTYPWRLIDDSGLRGYSIGGASVSVKHCGFIVNDGGASAEDYIGLSNHIEKEVLDKFGIKLEREIEIM